MAILFQKSAYTVTVLISVLAAATAEAQTGGRPDGLRFVPNVSEQFGALMQRADVLGFHITGTPNPTECKHYQGIVRVDGVDGTPYFLLTKSGNIPSQDPSGGFACGSVPGDHDDGHLVVVRMESRPTHGERLRSNRLDPARSAANTPPPAVDRATRHFVVMGGDPDDANPFKRPGLRRPDAIGNDRPRVYLHPGSMQVIGKMLAVALENPRDSAVVPETLIMFFDISNPEQPVFRSQFAPVDENESVLGAAGVVAITPLPGGRYLMVTAGGKNEKWFFYRSTLSELSSTALEWDFIGWAPGPRDGNEELPDVHNSLTFLREGMDSFPFIAGARGSPLWNDRDRIDLYRVRCETLDCEIGTGIEIEVVFNGRRIIPFHTDGGIEKVANLAAASTFYVSPSGELILYATDHANNGPGGTVDAGEWRHTEVVRPGSPTLRPSVTVSSTREVDEGGAVFLGGTAGPPVTKAFIQLFAGLDFTSFSILADLDDLHLERRDNLAPKARSWIWHAPPGCTAFAGSQSVGQRTLPGTGAVESDHDLRFVMNDTGIQRMDQRVTTIGFAARGACKEYYDQLWALRWDLDRDGTFETFGSPIQFSAANVDGPSVIHVPAISLGMLTGDRSQTTATIVVRNVPPVPGVVRLTNVAGQQVNTQVPFVLTKLPVTLHATFTDRGRFDRQTATLTWDDGTFETQATFAAFDDAFGDGTGSATHRHTYETPGVYEVFFAVTDDDGEGRGRYVNIRVVAPDQAIVEILAMIDQAIASAPKAALQHLHVARTVLVGNRTQSGALYELRRGERAAAIPFVQQAIVSLRTAQQAGANVATIAALLDQVVTSLSAR